MPEEVLFETESTRTRADIASYLRRVADNLDSGDPITLRAGDQEVTMAVPEQLVFEVKAEREGPVDGQGELSVEFELEWDENGGSAGDPEIE